MPKPDDIEYPCYFQDGDQFEAATTNFSGHDINTWLWGKPNRKFWVYIADANQWVFQSDKTVGNWTAAVPPDELRMMALLGVQGG